jgi:DNA polymerase-3 subunit epsilon
MFPIGEMAAIQQQPENYRLLRRVPWTEAGIRLPIAVSEPRGEEQSFVCLDVETTGVDAKTDKIIELGLVKGRMDSEGQITSIRSFSSMYEDPGVPIPKIITDITGITDEMVRGQYIDPVSVISWFDDDPIVIAHNAKFDREFFEARFSGLNRLRWACSITDIPWRRLGFESTKLEYLLLKLGYFYEGHRASIDALATAFLINSVPEAAGALLEGEGSSTVKIEAIGCPFDCKDSLKGRGYRWNPDDKLWHTQINEVDLPEELAMLSQLYPSGGDRARKTVLSSRDRYKAEAQ